MKDLAEIILETDGALGVRRVNELKDDNIITAKDFVKAWEKDKFHSLIEKQRQNYIEADKLEYPEDKTKDRRIFAKRKTLRINSHMYRYIRELYEVYENYSGNTIPEADKPWLQDHHFKNHQITELREIEKMRNSDETLYIYLNGLQDVEIKAKFNHKVNHQRLSKYQKFTNKAVLYCEACNTISCIEIEKAKELAEFLSGQKIQLSFKKNYFHSRFCKFCDSQQMEVVIKKIEAGYDNTSLKKLKKRYREGIKQIL